MALIAIELQSSRFALLILGLASVHLASSQTPPPYGSGKFPNKMAAATAIQDILFGNDETWTVWTKTHVSPSETLAGPGNSKVSLWSRRLQPFFSQAAMGALSQRRAPYACSWQPVQVAVSVMIEKIRIDTREQTATIKWWLRQSWRDQRYSWDLSEYTYSVGTSSTGAVPRITRPGGIAGGVWVCVRKFPCCDLCCVAASPLTHV